MLKRVRVHRPTHSVLVAYLALFLALGGSSYAAITITGKNVKNSSLTTKDVKNKSLLRKDFKPGQVPAGATGPAGPAGIAGVSTVDGPAGAYGTSGADAVESSIATCPPGSRVVGGGFNSTAIYSFVEFAKADATSYGVIVVNNGPNPGTITAQAICASGPGLASTARTSALASERRTIERRVAELRAQRK